MFKKIEFLETITRLGYTEYNINNIKDITFQVTDDCCCNCSYCYQKNKQHNYMTKEIAKESIDLLYNLSINTDTSSIINNNTKSLLLNFTGGEPLMNIEIIDYLCSYFMEKGLTLNHPWIKLWQGYITSNGTYYFTKDVQNFLNKFNNFIYIIITLDGPKEIHNSNRIYHDGSGNFDDAYAAFKDCQKRFNIDRTKMTVTPNNLNNINEVIDFFINEQICDIELCPIYEHKWTIEEGQSFYQQLKQVADKKLKLNNFNISSFNENIGQPINQNNLSTWCGGSNNSMLCFTPTGNIYPCIRYNDNTILNDYEPLIIGNIKDGIYNTIETKQIYQNFKNLTRRTQTNDQCFYCPIASGCSYCCAYDYITTGQFKRNLNNCTIHKTCVLANAYYWNNYYIKNKINKVFHLNLTKEQALDFINNKEYNNIIELIKFQKEKIGENYD